MHWCGVLFTKLQNGAVFKSTRLERLKTFLVFDWIIVSKVKSEHAIISAAVILAAVDVVSKHKQTKPVQLDAKKHVPFVPNSKGSEV